MSEQATNNHDTNAVEGELIDTDTQQVQPEPVQDLNSDANERIAKLEQEVADYKDRWMRSAADYRNLKTRSERERGELIRNASAGLLLKLLPVVDDLDRATASITPEIADSQWYGGFKLIPQKLRMLLESEGVTAIETEGQEFDPNKHEAVIYDESGEGNTSVVVAELQKGYTLRDKVLRPAMVKVGRK